MTLLQATSFRFAPMQLRLLQVISILICILLVAGDLQSVQTDTVKVQELAETEKTCSSNDGDERCFNSDDMDKKKIIAREEEPT